MNKSIASAFTFLCLPLTMASALPADGGDAGLAQTFDLQEIAARGSVRHQRQIPSVPSAAGRSGVCDGVDVDRYSTGALYRKVQSTPNPDISAFKGEGVLPVVHFDLADNRNYVSQDHPWNTGPLDRPSVYMGIVSPIITVDLGFTWTRIWGAYGGAFTDLDLDKRPGRKVQKNEIGSDFGDKKHRFFAQGGWLVDGNGQRTNLQLPAGMPNEPERDAWLIDFLRSKGYRPDFAFNPYWRVAESRTRTNSPGNPPAGTDAYFFPGEPFTMEIRGKIEAVTRSEGGMGELIVSDKTQNKEYRVTDITIPSSLREECVYHHRCSIKRVNSIDQFRLVDGERKGNETHNGYKARIIPTKAEAVGASWSSVVLIHRPRVQVTIDGETTTYDTSNPSDMRKLYALDFGTVEKVKLLHSLKADDPVSGPRCFEVRGGDTAANYLQIFHITQTDDQKKRGGESIDINAQSKQATE